MTDWSDEKILSKCVYFGEQARTWRNKFLGLLPEVNRRRLFELRGFASIFEFAFKIGGVSEEQVKTVIRTEDSLRDKPQLHRLLVSGEVSINKMVRIHSIATKENEELLASQVRILPQKSLETLVKDIKHCGVSGDPGFMRAHEGVEVDAAIFNEQTKKRLVDLHNKGINVDELINELLDKREREIEEDKEKIVLESNCARSSRYIPIRIKKLISEEYGTKCSIPSCNKSSREIHHAQRFALSMSHDPRYLAPLCVQHHQIAHAIDVKVVAKRMEHRYP